MKKVIVTIYRAVCTKSFVAKTKHIRNLTDFITEF